MTDTLIGEGITIMLIGITFVMSFLCILVISMGIMSKIVGYLNTIFPEAVPEVNNKKSTGNNDEEAVAIAIALAKAQG